MHDGQQRLINDCANTLLDKMPWIEMVSGHFEGAVLHLHVAHSYPVDVRRDVRRIVRRIANKVQKNLQIELQVEQVAPGYARAVGGAQEIAAIGEHAPEADPGMWN